MRQPLAPGVRERASAFRRFPVNREAPLERFRVARERCRILSLTAAARPVIPRACARALPRRHSRARPPTVTPFARRRSAKSAIA